MTTPNPPDGPPDGPSDAPARVRLCFEPSGKQVSVPPGVSVFEAASWNGIAIDSTCGGHGTCRKCRIRVVEGEVPVARLDPRAFDPDRLREGWRLACLAQASGDLTIEVPPLSTRPKAATVGVGRQVILRPAVQKRYAELAEPTFADQTPDVERLLRAIDDLEVTPDLYALQQAGKVMRKADFKVTAVVVDETLIDVEPGDTTARRFGIAFDLGTTTVVATLLDLSTGTPAAVRSMLNLQQPFGADVISRISAGMLDPTALDRLREAARDTLDQLTGEVCKQGEVAPGEVYEIALAGNATMAHIALGIDPEPLGVAPFIMAARSFPPLLAADLGVRVHPRARAVVLPALGAYVGGDIVAGALATGMDRDRRLRLFIDVGTNCEIVLGNADRLLATAAPAGPAFEGAQIRCGMRAAPGAIETVRITPETGRVELGVIGDTEPAGLCGSGLVDAVAELCRVGLLDASGRLASPGDARRIAPALADRLTTVGDERVFLLTDPGSASPPDTDPASASRSGSGTAPEHGTGISADTALASGSGTALGSGSGTAPASGLGSGSGSDSGSGSGSGPAGVYLSQRDVRELQFAKGAISTGWRLLLEEYGVAETDLQQVLLAGSFGTYLSPASAVRIGLVPRLALPRIVSAGNVAGEGAKLALLSIQERAGALALLEEVRYVELSDRPGFNDRFVDQLAFPTG